MLCVSGVNNIATLITHDTNTITHTKKKGVHHNKRRKPILFHCVNSISMLRTHHNTISEFYFNAIHTNRSGLLRKKSAPRYIFNRQSYKYYIRCIYYERNEKKIRSSRSVGKITPHHKQSTPPHHHHTTPKTKLRFKMYFINAMQPYIYSFRFFVSLLFRFFIHASVLITYMYIYICIYICNMNLKIVSFYCVHFQSFSIFFN